MREESHLDDMRAAIRGDFERLAERRGGQELLRDGETAADAEPLVDPEPHPDLKPLSDLEPDPSAPVSSAPEVEDETAVEPSEPQGPAELEPKRSWLARILDL